MIDKNFLTVSLVSISVETGNPKMNHFHFVNSFNSKFKELNESDIVLYPELSLIGTQIKSKDIDSEINNFILEALKFSKTKNPILVIGAPIEYDSKLYNCSIIIKSGKILGIVPKVHTHDNIFYPGSNIVNKTINLNGIEDDIPFSNDLKFISDSVSFSVMIGEDITDTRLYNGSQVILNPSSYNKLYDSRPDLEYVSKKLRCGVCSVSSSEYGLKDKFSDKIQFLIETGNIVINLSNTEINESYLIRTSVIDIDKIKAEKRRQVFSGYRDGSEVKVSYRKDNSTPNYKIRSYPRAPFNIDEEETLDRIECDILNLIYSDDKNIIIELNGSIDNVLLTLICIKACSLTNRSKVYGIVFDSDPRTPRLKKSNINLMIDVLGDRMVFKSEKIKSSDVFDISYEKYSILNKYCNNVNGVLLTAKNLTRLILEYNNKEYQYGYNLLGTIPSYYVGCLLSSLKSNDINGILSGEELYRDLIIDNNKTISPSFNDYVIYHYITDKWSKDKIKQISEMSYPEMRPDLISSSVDEIISLIKSISDRDYSQVDFVNSKGGEILKALERYER